MPHIRVMSNNLIRNAVIAIIPVVLASVLGGFATQPQIGGWYATLAKPSFNPPGWAFGVVWPVLYAMMAYAVFRILQLPSGTVGRSQALRMFFVQLALNASWSWAFFALQSPVAGILVILPLLASIVATIALFRPLDKVASLLLVPYVLWVSFATLLNVSIWWLNR
ncbi:MAG: TspO/MBR family protein [Bosea sp. (in: a-proteobacteria)]